MLTLQWKHVDLDHGCLRLPDSKTGAKVIHLPAPAIELLVGIVREASNSFVIPGQRSGAHLKKLKRPWSIVRQRAGLEGLRIHDLRHTYASVAAGAGLSLPMIGRLLGHTVAETTKRYSHLEADPVKRATETVGATIAAAMRGETGEVIDMTKVKK